MLFYRALKGWCKSAFERRTPRLDESFLQWVPGADSATHHCFVGCSGQVDVRAARQRALSVRSRWNCVCKVARRSGPQARYVGCCILSTSSYIHLPRRRSVFILSGFKNILKYFFGNFMFLASSSKYSTPVLKILTGSCFWPATVTYYLFHIWYRERKCAKILINDTINFFLKLQSAFWQFQTITVSECCLIKLLPCILFENVLIF